MKRKLVVKESSRPVIQDRGLLSRSPAMICHVAVVAVLLLAAGGAWGQEHVVIANGVRVEADNISITRLGNNWQNARIQVFAESDNEEIFDFTLEGSDDGFSDHSFAFTGAAINHGRIFLSGWDRDFRVGVPARITTKGFVFMSPNGQNWIGKVVFDERVNGIASSGDILVVAGWNGWVARSLDSGGSWESFRVGGNRDDYSSVHFADGQFFIVNRGDVSGRFPSYATSVDGKNWNRVEQRLNRSFAELRIDQQPRNTVVAPDASVRLSVGGVSREKFAIQWFRDGQAIEGATSTILELGAEAAGSQFHATIGSGGQVAVSCSVSVEGIEPKDRIGFQLFGTGRNNKGQLGLGDTNDRSRYSYIADNVASISAGGEFSTYIDTDGDLWGMGANGVGELGTGDRNSVNRPVKIASGVLRASAGVNHLLYVDEVNQLWATGTNTSGQSGRGSQVILSVKPGIIAEQVDQIAAGETASYFTTVDGTLYGIGNHEYGALGLGFAANIVRRPAVIDVDVIAIAAGQHHLVYLKSDGTAWVAGQNHKGQFGNGERGASFTPILLRRDVLQISAGMGHTLFLDRKLDMFATGFNFRGAIGDGTNNDRLTPFRVATGVAGLSTDPASSATHYLTKSGDLWAAGFNSVGALGDGSTTHRSRPVKVASEVVAIDSGAVHTLILKRSDNMSSQPVVILEPNPVTANGGENVVLQVVASGQNLTYEWFRNAQRLPGPTSEVLELASVDGADGGVYHVEVVNSAGRAVSRQFPVSVFDDCELPWTPEVPEAAPTIVRHPGSLQVEIGQSARFSVEVAGHPSPDLQWLKDEVALSGENEVSLQITSVGVSDAGRYQVRATNGAGEVLSDVAVLTVVSPDELPMITEPPLAQQVELGGTVNFVVGVRGQPAPTLQWFKDGEPIPGATQTVLRIGPVADRDTGLYSVRAENRAGSVVSEPVALVFTEPDLVSFVNSLSLGDTLDVWSDVAMDAEGNAYLLGTFVETLFLFGEPFESQGETDIVVVKLAAGENSPRWVRQFGGIGEELVVTLESDPQGGVVITGGFSALVAFDDQTLRSAGGLDAFVVKLSEETGAVDWAVRAGGQFFDISTGVAFDAAGGIYVLGEFDPFAASFGPFSFNEPLSIADIFVARLNPDASFRWVRPFGGLDSLDLASHIRTDPEGNAVFGGGFLAFVEGEPLGPFHLGGRELRNRGEDDVFLGKVNAAGDVLWQKHFGGQGIDWLNAMAVNEGGEVFLSLSALSATAMLEEQPFDVGETVVVLDSDGALVASRSIEPFIIQDVVDAGTRWVASGTLLDLLEVGDEAIRPTMGEQAAVAVFDEALAIEALAPVGSGAPSEGFWLGSNDRGDLVMLGTHEGPALFGDSTVDGEGVVLGWARLGEGTGAIPQDGTLTVTRVGNQIVVSWEGGRLWETDRLGGTWQESGAGMEGGEITVDVMGSQRFFRLAE